MPKQTILSVLKILVFQAAMTLLAILLLACLMLKLEWGDETLKLGVRAAYGIVCFLGGFLAGLGEKKKKFLRGLLSGVLYFGILLFLSLAGGRALADETGVILMNLGICAGAGMLGGMCAGLGRF